MNYKYLFVGRNKESREPITGTRLSVLIQLQLKSICYVNIDELQCNVGSLNPYDFTRKFEEVLRFKLILQLSPTAGRIGKRMHKSTTQRDILNNAGVK